MPAVLATKAGLCADVMSEFGGGRKGGKKKKEKEGRGKERKWR